ncbi:RagB/SusD family nutrient uptake outer membrane protein [Polaribacter porphyrae]|uniref:RagB/SusD family nutrient uptake outer membrane protein n=1 Tax=Polaribacter porphyrae TaxID=1137780 RepID=A0A2S7WTM4_9FLAO|nr:RagB/SusD family nutrient uptake outer membrane protein [Polaribacter porphyrae]
MTKALYTLSLVLFLTQCDDYLSELPDDRTLIDTPDKISSLLVNAYPDGNYMMMAEFMSDNVGDTKNITNTNPLDMALYKWENTNLEDRDTPVSYWNSCYEAISQANQALQSIKELEGGFDLKAQKGEALIARAYAHFMLVSFWSKRYNPTTASTDLGVPYVLEPETVLIKEYKRNTIQEVYDFIEKDLVDGLQLVTNNYNKPKFHFNNEAAHAFASRFYLHKGDWDKVIEHSSKAISDGSQIRNIGEYRALSFSEQRQRYASVTDNSNLLIVSTSSLYARTHSTSRFGLDPNGKLPELFGSSETANPFNKRWSYPTFRYNSNGVRFRAKFLEYFKVTNASAGIGLPFLGIVLFTKDEALLNRAEAYVMKKNYAGALSDLNIFLSFKTRGYNAATDNLTETIVKNKYPVVADEFTPFYTIDATQTSYIKGIAEYKRREFYHEGLRWFDVKRFNLKVEHELEGSGTLTLNKDDNRRVLQIPASAIQFGLQQNPK